MQSMPLGMELSPDENDLAGQAADVAASLRPIAPDADTSDELHPELTDTIRKSGLFGHFVPAEFGGRGLSVFAIALIRERLAYESVAADEFFASQGIPVQPIALFGTGAQKHRYLPALLDGSRTFAFCMTEPSAGSDILGIRSTATPAGAGYTLAGTKRYVFAGDKADTFVVIAKAGDPDQRAGLTAFLFDRPETGIAGTPMPLLAPGPEWELKFDCPVGAGNLLGEVGGGARIALGNLDRLRPTVGAAALGMAQRALDEAVAYTRQRSAFGGALADFQGIQFGLASAAAEIEAARSLVYGACRFADSAADSRDERRLIRASSAKAKLFATEVAQRSIDTALQYHGGNGLVRGSVLERLYRAVRATRIYEGAAEIMKVVIARSLLAEPVSSGRAS